MGCGQGRLVAGIAMFVQKTRNRNACVVSVIVLLPAHVGYACCTIRAQRLLVGWRLAVHSWTYDRVTRSLGLCAGQ